MSDIRKVAKELLKLQRQVDGLSGGTQLAFSSIEDGAVNEYNSGGQLVSIIGNQFDGSHGAYGVTGPIPPTPTAPIITAGRGSLTIRWNGVFVNAEGQADITVIPTVDFSHVEVHVSADPNFDPSFADTLVGTITTSRGGEVVVAPLPASEHYVRLVARTNPGKASAPSLQAAATPLVEATAEAVQAAADAAAAADQKAQAAQDEIDNSVQPAMTQLNLDMDQAQLDVANAVQKATDAETAASGAQTAASQAAADADAAATSASSAQTAASAASADADAAALSASGAQADADAAAASAASADTRATNAETAATNAQTSASAAASDADAAALSASNAQTSANSASLDAADAETAATNSANSAAAAAVDANDAQTAASNAATSASTAQTQATQAATDADAAAASAASADSRATSAETAANNAVSTANAAQTDASNALTAANNAETTASNAETAASNAQTAVSNLELEVDKKTTMNYDTVPPGTAVGTTVGDTWHQKDASGETIGIWEWTGSTTGWESRPVNGAILTNLVAESITSGTLSTARLNASDLRAHVLSAGKITAADIVAGSLTSASGVFGDLSAASITSGTLSTARLDAGDLRAHVLSAGKITAADIVTGTLTSASGVFGTMDASVINAGTLSTARLNAGDLRAHVLSAGKITASDIVSGTLTSASGVFGDISAVSITSGILSADRIGAKSINADKITISDFTNLLDDPEIDGSGWINSAGGSIADTNGGPGAAWMFTANGTQRVISNKMRTQVHPGEKFYVEAKVQNTSDGTLVWRIDWHDIDDILLSSDDLSFSGSWKVQSHVVTAPANAYFMRARFVMGADATTGNAWCSKPIIRRMTSGKLIVDGTIEAVNIKTGTLTSASGVFGDISAANIQSGTLSTARLNAGDLRAHVLSAGKITASDMVTGTLTSASGVFGTMDASVINAGTLSTARLDAGDLRAHVLSAGKIAAADIVTGTLTSASGVFGDISAANIQSGTLSTARLDAGDLRAHVLSAGKITAADMVTGTLTSASGVFGTMDASVINAGTLSTARLNAGDLRAHILSAGKITANDIVAGTLTSASGVFGTMDASVINAGTLSTARLNAGDLRAHILSVGLISATDIEAGAIQTEHLALGAVGKEQIGYVGIEEFLRDPKWLHPDRPYDIDGVLYFVDPTTGQTAPHPTGTVAGEGWHWDTNPANLRFGQVDQLFYGGEGGVGPEWQLFPVGPMIPVEPGERYYLGIDTYQGSANFHVGLAMVLYDASGVRVETPAGTPYYSKVSSSVTQDRDRVWESHEHVFTVPDGAAMGFPVIEAWNRTTEGVTSTGESVIGASGYVLIGAVSFRRALSGTGSYQHAELSPAGVRLFNKEGTPVVNLTSVPPNFLSIMDDLGNNLASLSDTGTVAGQDLNIRNDPVFMGDPLLGDTANFNHPSAAPTNGLLDMLPRGMVARGYRSMASSSVTNQEREILELSYYRYGGRAYKIIVTPWSVYIDGAYGYIKCYYTTDGSRPTMSSPILQVKTVRNTSTDGTMMDMGTEWYDLADTGDGIRRYLFTFEALNGSATVFGNSSDGSQFRVWVEDIGLAVPETGLNRTGSRSNGGSSPAPPPEDEPQNYTKTYNATGGRTYYSDGTHYNWNNHLVYQGLSPAVGELRSVVTFPSMTSDLSGATIQSIKVFIYFDHWYYSSGGTAKIGLHADVGAPNATIAPITHAVTSSSWPNPGGRWVSIPSSFWNGFKDGTYRGIALGDTSGSYSEYGYARWDDIKIEVKYTK